METENPYQTPSSVASTNSGNGKFFHLDFKQLKKVYHRSVNLRVITFLLILGVIGTVIQAFTIKSTMLATAEAQSTITQSAEVDPLVINIVILIFILLAIFFLFAVFGLYQRTSWGKVLGIIACILMLISIPVGTIIGIAGLFAIFGSPKLFGKDRFTHKELKAEFKLRKKNGHQ